MILKKYKEYIFGKNKFMFIEEKDEEYIFRKYLAEDRAIQELRGNDRELKLEGDEIKIISGQPISFDYLSELSERFDDAFDSFPEDYIERIRKEALSVYLSA